MDLSRVCCALAVVANIFVTCRRRCLTGPEDSETAKRSFIDGTSAKVDRVPSENSGNPSSRRGGLKLACEACKGIDDNVLELTISQHKRTTEIGWRYSPKSSDKLI